MGQDAALWNEVRGIFQGFEKTAFAKELKAVFENLNDEEVLEVLGKARWTRRPGYPIKAMWRTIIASYVLDIPTIQELIRRFHRDLFLAGLCGIHSEEEIPSRFAYYRFIKKLIDHREFIEKCMAKTIEALKRKYPDLGKIVVVDRTDIESYVNWRRKPFSDQDAEWDGGKISGLQDAPGRGCQI